MYDDLQDSMHGDAFVHSYLLLMHAYCLAIADFGVSVSNNEAITYLQSAYPELLQQIAISDDNPGCSLELLKHYSAIICAEYGIHSGVAIASFLNERQYWTTL